MKSLKVFLVVALLLLVPAAAVSAFPGGEGPLGGTADQDGDGIPDVVERDPAYQRAGGSPRHKDVWVECDYMRTLKPSPVIRQWIKQTFQSAKVKNPSGRPGVKIHFNLDDQFRWEKQWGNVDTEAGYLETRRRLLEQREKSFDEKREGDIWGNKKYVHYCVFIHSVNDRGTSGISMSSTARFGGIPGDVFIVSLGLWSRRGGTPQQQAGTFIHELGHNLGLKHGGNDHLNYKPNYASVMNYHYQEGFLRANKRNQAFRVNRWDYSWFKANTLNERLLREKVGVRVPREFATKYVGLQYCQGQLFFFFFNAPADWNCDGFSQAGPLRADTNNDGALTVLQNQNNWANIAWRRGGNFFTRNRALSPNEPESEFLDPSTELTPELSETINRQIENSAPKNLDLIP